MEINSKVTPQAKKKNGFTMIEVFSFLALLGIVAAVAVPKFVDGSTAVAEEEPKEADMKSFAKTQAIDTAVAELNGRESIRWGKQLVAPGGWAGDAVIFAAVGTELGDDYVVTSQLATGASISFQGDTAVALTRTASTAETPGSWSR